MKILYDFQMFSMQQYGGISRYFYELIKEFRNDSEVDTALGVKTTNNYYLSHDPVFGEKLKQSKFLPFDKFLFGINFRGKGHLYTTYSKVADTAYKDSKAFSREMVAEGCYDILHPTYYFFSQYYDGEINKPLVITVFDLIHEIFPEHFDSEVDETAKYTEIMVKRADKIIAISENTKKDVVEIYDIPEEKIDVVHLAASLNLEKLSDGFTLDLPEKYILYVGSRAKYKNFETFMEVMAEILQKDKIMQIVCAGGGAEFTHEEIDFLKKLGIYERVQRIKGGDDELIYAYKNAQIFVFPSLYEGFGIPLLEAMNCDCPIVCSDTSCFPEIAGDAAIYFNPEEPESMKASIKQVLQEEGARERLIAKGRSRRKDFSFAKTAKQTKEIYKNLLASNNE